MPRRSLTLLIASVGAAAAIAVSVLVPVPYVILGPGPTLNTLGKDSSGQPLITVSGHASYPTNGHLNMVTVTATWWSRHQRHHLHGAGGLAESGTGGSARIGDFRARSDPAAEPAAGHPADDRLAADRHRRGPDRAAHRHTPTRSSSCSPKPGYPAHGVLEAGDVITAVDGKPVTGPSGLTALIAAHPAGSTLTVTIDRHGKTGQVAVGTRESGGHPVMGVDGSPSSTSSRSRCRSAWATSAARAPA